jgi:hypothetical protein
VTARPAVDWLRSVKVPGAGFVRGSPARPGGQRRFWNGPERNTCWVRSGKPTPRASRPESPAQTSRNPKLASFRHGARSLLCPGRLGSFGEIPRRRIGFVSPRRSAGAQGAGFVRGKRAPGGARPSSHPRPPGAPLGSWLMSRGWWGALGGRRIRSTRMDLGHLARASPPSSGHEPGSFGNGARPARRPRRVGFVLSDDSTGGAPHVGFVRGEYPHLARHPLPATRHAGPVSHRVGRVVKEPRARGSVINHRAVQGGRPGGRVGKNLGRS